MSPRDRTPPGWAAYFWPGTEVLRNKLNLRDADQLTEAEYRVGLVRSREIRTGRVQIARTFDPDHLRAIHRHLFGDLYEWAGEYRVVNVSKSHPDTGIDQHFGDHASMGMYMRQLTTLIGSFAWGELELEHTPPSSG